MLFGFHLNRLKNNRSGFGMIVYRRALLYYLCTLCTLVRSSYHRVVPIISYIFHGPPDICIKWPVISNKKDDFWNLILLRVKMMVILVSNFSQIPLCSLVTKKVLYAIDIVNNPFFFSKIHLWAAYHVNSTFLFSKIHLCIPCHIRCTKEIELRISLGYFLSFLLFSLVRVTVSLFAYRCTVVFSPTFSRFHFCSDIFINCLLRTLMVDGPNV